MEEKKEPQGEQDFGRLDNTYSPFVPQIRYKPNAITPLFDYSVPIPEDGYPHPYEDEIAKLKEELRQYYSAEPSAHSADFEKCRFTPLERTPMEYICSTERLDAMIDALQQESIIAVDIEGHSYHSYQGLTCLIQISTPAQDYIIDAIALYDNLASLNIPFTNPQILKLFHGGRLDLLGLQRDFGVYCVHCFDTQLACTILGLPLGLDSLVLHYCDIQLDKSYQRADWRIRPLPKDMLDYARSDAHFLLYIYHRLYIDLLSHSAPPQPPPSTLPTPSNSESPEEPQPLPADDASKCTQLASTLTPTPTPSPTPDTTCSPQAQPLQLQKRPSGGGGVILKVMLDSQALTLLQYEKKQLKSHWRSEGSLSQGWAAFKRQQETLILQQQQRTVFTFTHQQEYTVDCLYRWRDRVARKKDEGVDHILNKMIIFDLSCNPPSTSEELLGRLGKHMEVLSDRVGELFDLLHQPVPPESALHSAVKAKEQRSQRQLDPFEAKLRRIKRELEEVERWLQGTTTTTTTTTATLQQDNNTTNTNNEKKNGDGSGEGKKPSRKEKMQRIGERVVEFDQSPREEQQLLFADLHANERFAVHRKSEELGLYHATTTDKNLIVRKLRPIPEEEKEDATSPSIQHLLHILTKIEEELGNYLPRSEEGLSVTVATGGNMSPQQRELLEKLSFDVLPALLTAAKLRIASSC